MPVRLTCRSGEFFTWTIDGEFGAESVSERVGRSYPLPYSRGSDTRYFRERI